jgi:D-arabinose 1-dehydrogenase-like Zn-dependent alcohol dehydrogenase
MTKKEEIRNMSIRNILVAVIIEELRQLFSEMFHNTCSIITTIRAIKSKGIGWTKHVLIMGV